MRRGNKQHRLFEAARAKGRYTRRQFAALPGAMVTALLRQVAASVEGVDANLNVDPAMLAYALKQWASSEEIQQL